MKKKKIVPRKTYKTHGWFVTDHAVKDMNTRMVSKGELSYNLITKPLYMLPVLLDSKNRHFRVRFSDNRIFTVTNPINRCVASVRKYKNKELRKAPKKYEKKRQDGKTHWSKY